MKVHTFYYFCKWQATDIESDYSVNQKIHVIIKCLAIKRKNYSWEWMSKDLFGPRFKRKNTENKMFGKYVVPPSVYLCIGRWMMIIQINILNNNTIIDFRVCPPLVKCQNSMFSGFIDTLMYDFSSTGVTIYRYFGLKFIIDTYTQSFSQGQLVHIIWYTIA
jgi:hypothetical protein